MSKRIIAAISAPVEYAESGFPTFASQGDEVELTAEAEKALEAQGALVPHGFESFDEFSSAKLNAYRAGRGDVEAAGALAEARAGGIVDLSAPVGEGDVAQLAAYIRDRKPSAADTVALAEGNPTKAKTVLEAESTATGGSPRKGVVSGLNKIIDES